MKGWLSTLLGGSASLVDKLWGQFAPLSNQQKQQNSFNASEAQKGRDFSAQQAELERDWQEEMYAKYNSIPGKIEQARQAGVNPMYAVTGSAVTPMQAHGPSASAPVAGSSGLTSNPVSLAGDILQFSKLKAEIDQMNAYTRQANANATNAEIDSQTRGHLNDLNMASIVQSIASSKADEGYKIAKTGEVAHLIMNADADTAVKGQQLVNMVADLANTESDTRLKDKQFDAVVAQIANSNADTDLKSAQILYTAMQTRSEKAMVNLITQNAHLSREQRKLIQENVHAVMLSNNYNEVSNAFKLAAQGRKDEYEEALKGSNEWDWRARWLVETVAEMLTFGGYVSFNETSNTSTNTTTVIDGNPTPIHKKVGF